MSPLALEVGVFALDVGVYVGVVEVTYGEVDGRVPVLEFVQPDTNKETATSNRTAITVIDLNCICLCKR
jgi:hypothetical protein